MQRRPGGKAVVTFLDAGICTELNGASRRAFVQIFWHICRGDGEAVARAVLDTASEEACEDREAFVKALAAMVDRHNLGAYDTARKAPLLSSPLATAAGQLSDVGNGSSGSSGSSSSGSSEERPAAAVGGVFELCRQHRVKLDGALSTVVVSTFILEGLTRSLDPNLHLFRAALPLLVTALPLAS